MAGDKRAKVTIAITLFMLIVSLAGIAMATGPVELECTVKEQGLVEIEVRVNDPRIKGLILKAKLPKGIKLLQAKPRARGVEKGWIKWFIDVRSRQRVLILATLSRSVRRADLTVEAVFKVPGRPGMATVRAR